MRQAQTTITIALAVAGALGLVACGGAPDDGSATDGQEAGRDGEATGTAAATAVALAPEEVRQAVADRITEGGDSITVTDPTRGSEVRLAFGYVHDHVKTSEGGRKFVCVDFRGPEGIIYDVDYYLDAAGGSPVVEDRILHKVGDTDVVPDSVRQRLDRTS